MKKRVDKGGNVWYYSGALSKTACGLEARELTKGALKKSFKKVKKVLDKAEWLCYNSLRRFERRVVKRTLKIKQR